MHFMTILFFVSKIQSSLCYNSLYNFHLQQTRRKIRNKNRHYSILSFFFSIIFFSQISSVTSIILFFSISFTGTSTLSSDTSVFYVCMQCSRFARMNIYVFTFLFRGLDNSFFTRAGKQDIVRLFNFYEAENINENGIAGFLKS